jgi:branched-chain amino acid transport system permease protein
MLAQGGIVNGAIYALVALALLLVFTVTRVILVPQGEFITYAAMTFAMLQGGQRPATAWLTLAMGCAAAAIDIWRALRRRTTRRIPRTLLICVVLPALLVLLMRVVPVGTLNDPERIALTLAIVVPIGPFLYRIVFEGLEGASVLVLLIVAVACDLAMSGVGLLLFGAEGVRADPLLDASWQVGPLSVSGQSIEVVGVGAALMLLLWLFFGFTLYGKALRATAVNRLGAKLVGIPTARSGRLCFAMAALIGAASGVLISSVINVYYDSGFLIGLKGFVAAIIGGLASYPAAVAGALLIGLLENFSSFWASAFKEVIVFTALLPVLFVRSFGRHELDDETEEA